MPKTLVKILSFKLAARVAPFFVLLGSFATPDSALACGLYEITGVVRRHSDAGFQLLTVAGSQSETIFSVKSYQEGAKLVSFNGATIRIQARLEQPISGMRGQIRTIESIQMAVPDPLGPPAGRGYQLLKREKCK